MKIDGRLEKCGGGWRCGGGIYACLIVVSPNIDAKNAVFLRTTLPRMFMYWISLWTTYGMPIWILCDIIVVFCACIPPYKQRWFISLLISKVPFSNFVIWVFREVICFYKLLRTFPPGCSIWPHRGTMVSYLPHTPLINIHMNITEHNTMLFPFSCNDNLFLLLQK